MLELIFQGFFEWMYGLILEAWEYFAFAILDVMSLDFAYLESHIPVMSSIRQVLLAGGWALLIGNLVFQAIKSMTVGLGFEGEDPKLLFTRTFVFSFLLVASPQICDLCLNMTSILMQTMEVPDAVDVHLVDSSAFGSLTVSWLLIIIFNLIIMYQVFKLLVEVAERYVILGVLTMVAPLAFGVGGSKSTSDIFTGWCRMYGSMCVLMVSHVIFLNMLLSVLSAVPSGLDTFLWMILLLAIVKTAKKSDSIITRIGLNPAFTGDALHVLPGALSYVLLHQATSQITKSLGKATGGTGRGRASGNSPPGKGPRSGGPRGAGTGSPGGSSYSYSNPSTSSSSYSGSTFSETSSTLTPPGGDTPQQPGGSKPSYGPVAPDNPMPTQKPHIQPKGRDIDSFYRVLKKGSHIGCINGWPLCGRCCIQRDCKLPPIEAYRKGLDEAVVQYIGIAYDEQERLLRLDGAKVSLLEKYQKTEADAVELCKRAGLYSPMYSFTNRGGCFFCPNAKRRELRHLYDHHPDLWARLLACQQAENKVTERFNRSERFDEIDAEFRWQDQQYSLFTDPVREKAA